jgi:hypothetical protein
MQLILVAVDDVVHVSDFLPWKIAFMQDISSDSENADNLN